jgi:hypothetical protein
VLLNNDWLFRLTHRLFRQLGSSVMQVCCGDSIHFVLPLQVEAQKVLKIMP